jgi:hypothetical protein
MTPEELERLVGLRVRLTLTPDAPGPAVVTGSIVGTTRALDGLVVAFTPDGAPGGRPVTYHYHYIESAEAAGPSAA